MTHIATQKKINNKKKYTIYLELMYTGHFGESGLITSHKEEFE